MKIARFKEFSAKILPLIFVIVLWPLTAFGPGGEAQGDL
jgi:hypothetical protein